MNLSNALALVTGASSGLGAATALALAKRGARLALCARTQAALSKVADQIRADGEVAGIFPCDLADFNAVERMAGEVAGQLGTPDVIVHSAGAGRWLFVEETSPAEAVQMMGAPYFAAFFTTRAFLPAMLRRGSGHIAVVNSPAARVPWPGATGYAAARWALQGFTNALRGDLRGTGLRVTSIVAGRVDTPYFDNNPGAIERFPRLSRLVPTVQPEQVAARLVRAVERGEREVIMPGQLRWLYALHQLMPRLVEEVVVRTGWRHTQGALA